MRTAALSLFLSLLASACCDRGVKRIQPHWLRVLEQYDQPLASAERRGATGNAQLKLISFPGSQQRCFESQELDGCERTQEYGFWLDLKNKGDKTVLLLWPQARFVDELGKTHEVYAPERGDLTVDIRQVHVSRTDTLEPGARRRPTIIPIYKQYMVGCKDPELFSEPLVPTRLDDKDEIATKHYVEDLAKRQVPVKLLLPIEIEGIRYEYTFTFVLRPR